MIFNEQHNYLFVHIQKTGGTSISAYLTEHCNARFMTPAHLQLNCMVFKDIKPTIFATVRNPWERLVSWYDMMIAKGMHNDFSNYLLQPEPSGHPPRFSSFIRRTAIIQERALPELSDSTGNDIYDSAKGYLKSLSFNQIDYLTDSFGNFACHHTLAFENLGAEFAAFIQKMHPDQNLPPLPHLNARSKSRAWRDYYSNEDREWVARLYQKDIRHFGFTF